MDLSKPYQQIKLHQTSWYLPLNKLPWTSGSRFWRPWSWFRPKSSSRTRIWPFGLSFLVFKEFNASPIKFMSIQHTQSRFHILFRNKFHAAFFFFWVCICKGKFLSEDTDVFVTSPNRWTFYFPELKKLNFCDRKLLRNQSCIKVWKLRGLQSRARRPHLAG